MSLPDPWMHEGSLFSDGEGSWIHRSHFCDGSSCSGTHGPESRAKSHCNACSGGGMCRCVVHTKVRETAATMSDPTPHFVQHSSLEPCILAPEAMDAVREEGKQPKYGLLNCPCVSSQHLVCVGGGADGHRRQQYGNELQWIQVRRRGMGSHDAGKVSTHNPALYVPNAHIFILKMLKLKFGRIGLLPLCWKLAETELGPHCHESGSAGDAVSVTRCVLPCT